MSTEKIIIQASIAADKKKVWDYYTNPTHIVNWNFADPSWHCPQAENDLKIGGKFSAKMEARDGSFGFEFEATYSKLQIGEHYTYVMADGREVEVTLSAGAGESQTEMVVQFDPENENPVEMQKDGWQAILNNFKLYAEKRN